MMESRAFRRHCFSAFLGLALLCLLVLLASLDDRVEAEAPERLSLREVRLYLPPPPPPPPPSARRQGARGSGAALALSPARGEVSLELMDLAVELSAGELGNFEGAPGLGMDAAVDWGAVSLAELDGYPMVMSAPVIHYPAEAIARGLDDFEVVFQILIDEEGRTYPIRLLENPLPAIERELMAYAAGVVFTPPKRLGIPVRTQYRWPVRFQRQ